MCLHVCMPVFITLHACRCLWRPEGGVRSHGTRVTCCEVVSCVIWMLGTKPGSSARPASALKHPAPSVVFLTTRIYGGYTAGWASVLNSQSTGHTRSRTAMNVAQHKTRNLFTTLRLFLLCFLQLRLYSSYV